MPRLSSVRIFVEKQAHSSVSLLKVCIPTAYFIPLVILVRNLNTTANILINSEYKAISKAYFPMLRTYFLIFIRGK